VKRWTLVNLEGTVAYSGGLLAALREWVLWRRHLPSQPMRVRRAAAPHKPRPAVVRDEEIDDGRVW
jgi:hypothetical protein